MQHKQKLVALGGGKTIQIRHLHLDGLKELKLIICMFIKQIPFKKLVV
jgi:hypothetical protein